MEIVRLIEGSDLGIKLTLKELNISKSTFYNWYGRYWQMGYNGLDPKESERKNFWNRIPDDEREKVVMVALEIMELSARELAWHITDYKGWYIFKSSVYRILKSRGLITNPAHIVQKAADEFKDKNTRINELG
jgi:transposase